MDIAEIWKNTVENVKNNISSTVGYNVHIKISKPVSLSNSVFTISVPTSINKNMIEFRYKNFIESSLEKITGEKLSLKVIVGDTAEPVLDNTVSEENVYSNELNDYGVNPKYTFENFVVGSSNEYANAAAKKTAESPGHIYNPLFIYGNSGLGKTHLMQAIGNRIKEKNPSANVIYVPCEKFTNEFIVSIREFTTDKFRDKYRNADVLLVDDVQFLEKKEAVQEEFFHTFNELFNYNKQIVLTSDRKPSDLTILNSRLRTRFGQGIIIDISIPNFETRVAILQKKAQAHNIKIDNSILEYIATNIRSSIRELEGALLNVISMSEIKECEITMDFVKKELEAVISGKDKNTITPQKIIKKVSVYYNISENDILGNVKTSEIAFPRQISMYLCCKMLSMNYTAIGKEFNKERTTVKHNVEKIEKDILTDDKLNEDINYITKDLESM
ncbi:MAG: chromosomal replication initiator protein DnaA [Clostridia bacterium]|nr:chromosomal replication initiator protein DnaA [Clostridia bacterium]MCI9086504.1 chromosomal replication initiator protein DnaA [Clostridia bacterium]